MDVADLVDAKLPSGKIQFARSFEVEAGETTQLLLDFEGDKSLVVTGGGDYIFKPVIKLTVPVQGGKPGPTTATEPEVEETVEPTATSVPTATATATPRPTATAMPTATPTATPEPTPSNDPLGEALFLDIITPQPEPDEDIIYVTSATVVIAGWTRLDAAVTIGEEFLEVDENGRFETTVQLEEGPNVIEVIASVGTGEEEAAILVVSFEP